MGKINKNKNKKGFTLIEMVVVLAILGILTVVLVPQAKKYIDRSKKVAIQAQCREIVIAVETYNGEVNTGDLIVSDNEETLIAYIGKVNLGVEAPKATLSDILKKIKIQMILGDSTNEGKLNAKEADVTTKLKNKFDKIPLEATYEQIKSVAEGAEFTIDNKGILSKVYDEAKQEMVNIIGVK